MSDQQPRAEDKLNNFTIAMVGGVSALLLWAAVIWLQAYYANTGGALEQKRATQGQDRELRAVQAEHLARISEYRAEGKRYAIPLDRAMELVVRDAANPSLVPAIGPHNVPTTTPSGEPVPEPGAVPADGEAVPADGEAVPADGDAKPAAPADGAAKPADGAAKPAAPATEEADAP